MSKKKNITTESKPHHVVYFPIHHVDGFEHPRDAFDKRFSILQHIHNVLVKEANARLTRRFSDKQYCALVQKYGRLKDKISEQERKALAKQFNTFVEKYELSGKYALHGYVTKVRNLYKANISSRQGQAEAERVMKGVEDVLYSTGKHLHFKKYSQMHSIQQNDTENGVKFNIKSEHGTWNGLRFWCPID